MVLVGLLGEPLGEFQAGVRLRVDHYVESMEPEERDLIQEGFPLS